MHQLHPVDERAHGRRTLVSATIVAVVAIALLVAWWAIDILLVVVAGILLALSLRGLAEWLAAYSRLPVGATLAAVILGLAGLLGLGGWLLADDVARQIDELTRQVPQALGQLRDSLARYSWGRFLLSQTPSLDQLISERLLGRAAGVFSTTLGVTVGVLTNMVIVLFIGLYLAVDPRPYTRGLLRLVPPTGRDRGAEVLAALARTLRRWLVGKVIAMAIIGTLTTAGLAVIGVPLALTLGLLAGLLSFIPYLGPIISFVPALLLALTDSWVVVAWVAGLYVLVQALESYLITPLVEREAVSLPPALTISAQVLLGVTAGWLGIVLASPLTAVAIVLVRMLYVEDVLGDRPGAGRPRLRSAG
ncbi:MAG: AI-2E family transporter [Candidatus Rokuibacteriota bacterium]